MVCLSVHGDNKNNDNSLYFQRVNTFRYKSNLPCGPLLFIVQYCAKKLDHPKN